jgi:hypothetical protein
MYKNDDDTAMVDIMTNLSMYWMICFLVVMAFVSFQKKIEQDRKIVVKADYMITVEWPENINVDVDTYVEDPAHNIAWFGKKDAGLMHLDRDDIGDSSDQYITVDGERKIFKENKETLTIRGFLPGEYIFNVQLYAKKLHLGDTPVQVRIEQLNPSVRTVFEDKLILSAEKDEKHVCRFTLDRAGNVAEITKTVPKSFTAINEGLQP